jgi:hypothetical protein
MFDFLVDENIRLQIHRNIQLARYWTQMMSIQRMVLLYIAQLIDKLLNPHHNQHCICEGIFLRSVFHRMHLVAAIAYFYLSSQAHLQSNGQDML